MVSPALRDIRVGNAGVQQHQQLPRLRPGGKNYGKTFIDKLMPAAAGDCPMPSGKQRAWWSVRLLVWQRRGQDGQILRRRKCGRLSGDHHGVIRLVTAPLVIVVLSINQDVSPGQSRLTDIESLAVISHKD